MRAPPAAQWRHLASPYRNYEVSDDGRVRRRLRELQGYVDRYGYNTVLLSYAGLSRRFKVHRLVCEMFHGPQPQGCEVRHLDGDRTNNRAENLRWGTRSENVQDSIRHGTFTWGGNAKNLCHGQPNPKRGEEVGTAKLSAQDVCEIRAKAARGQSGRSLSREYGLSHDHARRIIKRELWTHVA